jgi:hypothetical protein
MTFNDDKTQHNLRIAVELAQPARLYLLVDDRAEAPQWLTDSFTDTGWDIGIDEGFADVENVETAIGAGRSIEWTFSVWSRDVIAPSTVLLGSLQKDERRTSDHRLNRRRGNGRAPLGDGRSSCVVAQAPELNRTTRRHFSGTARWPFLPDSRRAGFHR